MFDFFSIFSPFYRFFVVCFDYRSYFHSFSILLRFLFHRFFIDTNNLDGLPFGILTEKAILRIPLKAKQNKTKKIVGNASLQLYSRHRWKKTTGEMLCSFFQHILRHLEKKQQVSNEDPSSPDHKPGAGIVYAVYPWVPGLVSMLLQQYDDTLWYLILYFVACLSIRRSVWLSVYFRHPDLPRRLMNAWFPFAVLLFPRGTSQLGSCRQNSKNHERPPRKKWQVRDQHQPSYLWLLLQRWTTDIKYVHTATSSLQGIWNSRVFLQLTARAGTSADRAPDAVGIGTLAPCRWRLIHFRATDATGVSRHMLGIGTGEASFHKVVI